MENVKKSCEKLAKISIALADCEIVLIFQHAVLFFLKTSTLGEGWAR